MKDKVNAKYQEMKSTTFMVQQTNGCCDNWAVFTPFLVT